VRAVIAMGRALGKRVIAEGIETEAQHDMLIDLGCDWGQGYLLARPMSPEDIELMIRNLVTPGRRLAVGGTSSGDGSGSWRRSEIEQAGRFEIEHRLVALVEEPPAPAHDSQGGPRQSDALVEHVDNEA